MKYTINVLASDFENNNYLNIKDGMKGCPMERAFRRAGFTEWYGNLVAREELPAEEKVIAMFAKTIPTEDFSFEIEI